MGGFFKVVEVSVVFFDFLWRERGRVGRGGFEYGTGGERKGAREEGGELLTCMSVLTNQ